MKLTTYLVPYYHDYVYGSHMVCTSFLSLPFSLPPFLPPSLPPLGIDHMYCTHFHTCFTLTHATIPYVSKQCAKFKEYYHRCRNKLICPESIVGTCTLVYSPIHFM